MNSAIDMKLRHDFLLKMYEQVFNNVNRHIMITWETIPVIGGALGAIALSRTISIDVSASMITLLAGWWWANSLDANEWVKRNLFIISNIERQFLDVADSKSIHYYFPKAHKAEVLRHFWIQIIAAWVILIMGLIWVGIDAIRNHYFPYLFVISLLIVIFSCCWLWNRTNDRQEKFAKKSPGLEINQSSV